MALLQSLAAGSAPRTRAGNAERLALNLSLFKLLSPEVQVRYTIEYGTYLAQRWEDEESVNLYYLPDGGRGFFIEVGWDRVAEQLILLRSFRSAVLLEDYTHYVQLPTVW